MAERKNPQLDAQHQAILRKMMTLSENKSCADCRGPSPRWASTNLGIFICITCSGIHRKLGTHISQVRSVTLDTWTPSQIQHFRKYGNAKAAHYFEACLPQDFRRPHASDSSQMERFIRDKYEHKRYITVENGGLGGQTVSRHRSSRLTSQPRPGPLGPRPTQSTSTSYSSGYDTTPSVRKTGPSSMSYGGRFSHPVQPAKGLSRGSDTRNSTGTYPVNAMQRASTLKQLLAMGFAQDIAVRAVDFGDGDLQNALDWILQQGNNNAENTTKNSAPSKEAQRDLLDFGEPSESTSTSAHKTAASKVMATETLIPSTRKDTAKSPTNDFADFADFGDFQRALPSASHAKNPTPEPKDTSASVTKNPILASSLADLYKKSPPKAAAQPHSAKMPQLQTPVSPIRNKLSPGITPKSSNSQRGEDLGLTTFESLSPKNLNLPTRSFPPINLARPSGDVHGEAKSPNGKKDDMPPPPPPQVKLYPSTADNPPPTPPPPKDGTPTTDYTSEPRNQNGDQQTNGGHEDPAIKPKEDEEEDPFAALSMMALSSATSAQKRKKERSAPSLSKGNAPSLSSVDGAQNDINLDELLS